MNVKECKETLRRIRRMDFQTKLTWFTSLNRYSWGREWKSFKAPSAWYSRSGCPVGWRDLALFFIFENLHISGIFLGVQFQKIGDFGCALARLRRTGGKVFIFKIYLYFFLFAETFFIHQRTIAKNKYFYFLKMGKTVFGLYIEKNVIFCFSSDFAFK